MGQYNNIISMEEIIKTFHIDTKLILAQFINFAIVFFVLYKFAYGPVLRVLKERTKKIEKGLRDAEESQKKLTEISEKEKEVLVKARKEAQEIIKKAEEQAVKNKEGIIAEANKQADILIKKAQVGIEEEKNKVMLEVKNEIAGLIMLATEKIVGEKINSESDKKIIDSIVK